MLNHTIEQLVNEMEPCAGPPWLSLLICWFDNNNNNSSKKNYWFELHALITVLVHSDTNERTIAVFTTTDNFDARSMEVDVSRGYGRILYLWMM